MKSFIDQLKQLEKEYAHHLNPSNHTGFILEFLPWLEKKWGEQPFFKTRKIKNNQNTARVLMQTDYTINECVNNYTEFLNAYNGTCYECYENEWYHETLRDDFIHMFHMHKFNKFSEMVEQSNLVLPQSLMTHPSQTVISVIWSNEWVLKDQPELHAFWRDFKSKYGSMGSFNECYLEYSMFSEMTFKDVQLFHNEIKGTTDENSGQC